MPKFGVNHDYDLMANREASAQDNTCLCCGVSPVVYQWSDYSGEAMCGRCGVPYQLKWGGKEKRAYPYLNLKAEWLPVVREYHAETGKFTYLGRMFGGDPPGLREFCAWVDKNNKAPETKG